MADSTCNGTGSKQSSAATPDEKRKPPRRRLRLVWTEPSDDAEFANVLVQEGTEVLDIDNGLARVMVTKPTPVVVPRDDIHFPDWDWDEEESDEE